MGAIMPTLPANLALEAKTIIDLKWCVIWRAAGKTKIDNL
jgi:hypothetical protein